MRPTGSRGLAVFLAWKVERPVACFRRLRRRDEAGKAGGPLNDDEVFVACDGCDAMRGIELPWRRPFDLTRMDVARELSSGMPRDLIPVLRPDRPKRTVEEFDGLRDRKGFAHQTVAQARNLVDPSMLWVNGACYERLHHGAVQEATQV